LGGSPHKAISQLVNPRKRERHRAPWRLGVHTRKPARSESPPFRPVSEALDEDDRDEELEPPDEELDDDELEEPGVDELLDEDDEELEVDELLDAAEELDDADAIPGATGLLPHAASAAAAASDAPPDSSCRKRRRFCRSLF
jgi:hypothetical protein